MTWHVAAPVLNNYIDGALDRAAAASIEAHVTACSQCRSLVPFASDWLEQSWAGIADWVEPPPVTLLERVLTNFGVKPHTARLLLLTPALRLAWLAAVIIAAAFALSAAAVSDVGDVVSFFLAVAPLVPVAGVALAYGPILDPAHELAMASPSDKFSLLMLRSVAVVVSSVVMLAAAQLVAPAAAGAGAWLLPSLALSATTLALATKLSPQVAGTSVAIAWVLLIASTSLSVDGPSPVFGGAAQATYVVLAGAAIWIVLSNRNSFNHRGGNL